MTVQTSFTPDSRPQRFAGFVTLALLLFAIAPAAVQAIDPVYSNWRGLAIRGADPVAYLTQGHHIEGVSAHSLEWMGASWRFASAENRAAFEASPEKYAPQYGGYCAYAVSQGSTASVDPEAFTIVEGKLYLNYSQSVQRTWLQDRDVYIEEADANWPGLRDG